MFHFCSIKLPDKLGRLRLISNTMWRSCIRIRIIWRLFSLLLRGWRIFSLMIRKYMKLILKWFCIECLGNWRKLRRLFLISILMLLASMSLLGLKRLQKIFHYWRLSLTNLKLPKWKSHLKKKRSHFIVKKERAR